MLKIFARALKLLISSDVSVEDKEDAINRRLYFCVLKAIHALTKESGAPFISHPLTYEARNQPDFDDNERAAREHKRPDFIWSIIDHAEPIPEKSAKHYCVECKRLGQHRNGRKPNADYINDGVRRFVESGHGYGKSARTGLMVGYVENSDIDTILAEVNAAAVTIALSPLSFSAGKSEDDTVNRLNQTLIRPHVSPSPFDLRHLWVDLRSSKVATSIVAS